MNLLSARRDNYVQAVELTPEIPSATWEASFDGGATWHDGIETDDGWAWLVAGPDFDADAVGMDAVDTVATIYGDVQPLLRCKDDPVAEVVRGTVIRLKGYSGAATPVVYPASALAALQAEIDAEEAAREAVDATLVRFRDIDGNPIEGQVVTITVNTTTDEVEDIIVEAAP